MKKNRKTEITEKIKEYLTFMTKTAVFLLCLVTFSYKLTAQNAKASQIKDESIFMMMGNIELRDTPDFNQPAKYKTLNHENGTKVKVVETGKEDFFNGKKGRWYNVITIAPLWADNGEWIKKYNKFWIFVPEDTEIFDFEE